jgi:hypothetical protein
MAMRQVLGAGQGSDMLRESIKATVPSPGAFSKAYNLSQLKKFEQQVNRLQRGIPGVKLAEPKGEIETPKTGGGSKADFIRDYRKAKPDSKSSDKELGDYYDKTHGGK